MPIDEHDGDDDVTTTVIVEAGRVVVTYSGPVSQLRLTPDGAREFARRLIVRADQVNTA